MRQNLDLSVVLLLSIAAPLLVLLMAPWWFGVSVTEIWAALQKFLGPWLLFFVPVAAFEAWVVATWLADRLGVVRFDDLGRFDQGLDWVTSTAPLAGLIGTALSALDALVTLGAAGIGNPVSRATFLSQFGIALGTTTAGATLTLIAVTIRKLLCRA